MSSADRAGGPAFMVVYMTISDMAWMPAYFADVPALLAEYGAVQIAGGRHIHRIEGDIPIPDRMAVFRFPSMMAAQSFMEDTRYIEHRDRRRQGSSSQILLLEGLPADGGLV